MKALDKTKPFAQIVGDDQGRVFEQDGHFFRGDGSHWGDAPKPRATTSKAPAPTPAPPAADDQLSQQLQG